ncbi:MAG: hypothetical protein AAF719_13205 [Pseudomonadota bacterium]
MTKNLGVRISDSRAPILLLGCRLRGFGGFTFDLDEMERRLDAYSAILDDGAGRTEQFLDASLSR